MHILRHTPEVLTFTHAISSIHQLLHDRLQYLLTEADTLDDAAWFIVLDPGDTARDLETALQAPWINLWEWKEDHPDCIELVFVHNDSGYGPIVIVPKQGSDPDILAAIT